MLIRVEFFFDDVPLITSGIRLPVNNYTPPQGSDQKSIFEKEEFLAVCGCPFCTTTLSRGVKRYHKSFQKRATSQLKSFMSVRYINFSSLPGQLYFAFYGPAFSVCHL